MSTVNRAQVKDAVLKEYDQLKEDQPVAQPSTIGARVDRLFAQLGATRPNDRITIPDDPLSAGGLYTAIAKKVFGGHANLISTYGLEPPAGANAGLRRPATQGSGRRSQPPGAGRPATAAPGTERPGAPAAGLAGSVAALTDKPTTSKAPPPLLPTPDADLQAILTSGEEPLARLTRIREFMETSADPQQQLLARQNGNATLQEYATPEVIESELATGKPTDAGMNPSYLTKHFHVKRQKPEETQKELDMNAAMAILNPATPFCCERRVTQTMLPSKDQKILKRASPTVQKMRDEKDKITSSGFVAEVIAGQGVVGTLQQASVKSGEEFKWLEVLAEQGVYELVVGKQDGIAERRTPPNNMVCRSSGGALSISPIDNTCTGKKISVPRRKWVTKLEHNVHEQLAEMQAHKSTGTASAGSTGSADPGKEAAILRGIQRALERVKTVQESGVFLHLEHSADYEANATLIRSQSRAVQQRLKR